MKNLKGLGEKVKAITTNLALMATLTCMSKLAFANSTAAVDIIKVVMSGSLGKTIGKEGMIWTVLIGVAFLVGGCNAAIKHDVKAFVAPFIITAIISTVVGVFITF